MSQETHEAKKAAMAELNRLAKAGGGRITPSAIVEAARDEDSALHAYFEWDDSTAAEQYRLMQARELLRSCKVEFKINDRKIAIPAYVRDPEADSMQQGYVETARIRNEAEAARDVLLREFSRVGSLLTRARRLAEFFEMESEVDDLSATLGLLRQKIENTTPHLNA
ncbi:MAG: hypothetical protein V2I51_07335 [Anderseniella sp.]|jgi:hypothetical protein|nr:hypothetical protein [Anderseniella sp.]